MHRKSEAPKFSFQITNLDLKTKLDAFAGYYHGLVDKVVTSEDMEAVSNAQFDLMTLSTDVRKEANEVREAVSNLMNDYAATPEGLLARKTRDESTKITTEEGLDIFKLPIKLVHKAETSYLCYLKWKIS